MLNTPIHVRSLNELVGVLSLYMYRNRHLQALPNARRAGSESAVQ